MYLPFKNPLETKMLRVIQRIKNGEEVKKVRWMNMDVLEDLRSVVDYSKLVEKNMGNELVFGILFGGVMRTPSESHAHSDIDLMLIYRSRVTFIPPKNKRISLLSYPEDFLDSMMVSNKLESSFIRCVFLQAHALLVGDEKKVRSLRETALQNFNMLDLVPLIKHRMKKSGLSMDESGIRCAMEMLGVADWVFSKLGDSNWIIKTIFETESSAANI